MDLKREVVFGFLSLDPPTRDQVLMSVGLISPADYTNTDPTARYVSSFAKLLELGDEKFLQFKGAIEHRLASPALTFDTWMNAHFRSKGKEADKGSYYYSRSGDKLFVVFDDTPSMGLYHNEHVTLHRSLKKNDLSGITFSGLSSLIKSAVPSFERAGTADFNVREQLLEMVGSDDLQMSKVAVVGALSDRERKIQAALSVCDKLDSCLEGTGSVGGPARALAASLRSTLA